MPLSTFLHVPVYLLAALGAAALVLVAMLAVPLKRPPPLASIKHGPMRIDATAKPDLTRFQARDGTWLAYRLYPSSGDRVAILAHGSSASSDAMNGIGKALAAADVTAVALDIRGHGASSSRGDIGYAGQLEDDLADLIAHLGEQRPNARYLMIGHSLGGGFIARICATPVGARFERFLLLSPFLGAQAPTNRPSDGKGRWAEVDLPRILALAILRRLGIAFGQSLPVIAYANDPAAAKFTTSVYSFRLLADYGPNFDWSNMKAAIHAAAGKLKVIAGADDELMDAPVYERELKPLGAKVTLLPGVDHMGIVTEPAALVAIVATAKED